LWLQVTAETQVRVVGQTKEGAAARRAAARRAMSEPEPEPEKMVAEAGGPGGSPGALDPVQLGAALEKGASKAAIEAPRTTDTAKLKLTTRKFIKADLQVRLAKMHKACRIL